MLDQKLNLLYLIFATDLLIDTTSLEQFYQQTSSLILEDINKEIGHFNVSSIPERLIKVKKTGEEY